MLSAEISCADGINVGNDSTGDGATGHGVAVRGASGAVRPGQAGRQPGFPHLQIRAVDSVWAAVASRRQCAIPGPQRSGVLGHRSARRPPDREFVVFPPERAGFSLAAANAATALDYCKAPLFDFPLGRLLPPSGTANADDLQDLLSLYLEQCKAAGGELYAFGMRFDSNRHLPIDAEFGNTDGLHGVHDIHMMQGNTGDHAPENGAFHDGGLLLAFPNRIVGIFLAFQTQRIPTDGHGKPTPDAKPLSAVIATGPAAPVDSAVYLERALINPAGPDPGREILVLANCATGAQSLAGWRLVDRNGRVTILDVEIGGGASTLLTLDGAGVQLGNSGGNVVLQDSQGNQVDSVTYSAKMPAHRTASSGSGTDAQDPAKGLVIRQLRESARSKGEHKR